MKVLKTIALIIFLSSVFTSFAQKSECKFDIDKKDAVTAAPVKKIKTLLTGTDIFYVMISRTDTSYSLILNFWFGGTLRSSIYKNDTLTFNLSGGEKLVLFSSKLSKPIPHYGDQTWTEYMAEYPIRSDDLGKLKSIIPFDVKLIIGKEPIYREFNKKDVDKIRDIIRCIMK